MTTRSAPVPGPDAEPAAIDDEFWRRLDRAVGTDGLPCACSMSGDPSCRGHVGRPVVEPARSERARLGFEPSDPAAPAQVADPTGDGSMRRVWQIAAIVTAVLVVGAVGVGVARSVFDVGERHSAADLVVSTLDARSVALEGAIVASIASTPPAESTDLPPMNMSMSRRLALFGASIACLAAGLSLGLTRRDRPVRATAR